MVSKVCSPVLILFQLSYCRIFSISQERSEWWSLFLANADKQSFLQVDTIILGVRCQAYLKYPNKFAVFQGKHEGWSWFFFDLTNFEMSLQYLKKEVRYEIDIFVMHINTKVFYKFISTLWTSKFPTRWSLIDWHDQAFSKYLN